MFLNILQLSFLQNFQLMPQNNTLSLLEHNTLLVLQHYLLFHLQILKNLYFSGNIHSINVIQRTKFQKISKCDYNKKQVTYLNKILRNI